MLLLIRVCVCIRVFARVYVLACVNRFECTLKQHALFGATIHTKKFSNVYLTTRHTTVT